MWRNSASFKLSWFVTIRKNRTFYFSVKIFNILLLTFFVYISLFNESLSHFIIRRRLSYTLFITDSLNSQPESTLSEELVVYFCVWEMNRSQHHLYSRLLIFREKWDTISTHDPFTLLIFWKKRDRINANWIHVCRNFIIDLSHYPSPDRYTNITFSIFK